MLVSNSATVDSVGNSPHRFPLRRASKYPWVFLKLLPVAQLSQVKQLLIVGWKNPQGRESSEGWIRFRANGYSRQRKLHKKMFRRQGWKYRIGLWSPWTPSGGLWASFRQWGLQRILEWGCGWSSRDTSWSWSKGSVQEERELIGKRTCHMMKVWLRVIMLEMHWERYCRISWEKMIYGSDDCLDIGGWATQGVWIFKLWWQEDGNQGPWGGGGEGAGCGGFGVGLGDLRWWDTHVENMIGMLVMSENHRCQKAEGVEQMRPLRAGIWWKGRWLLRSGPEETFSITWSHGRGCNKRH